MNTKNLSLHGTVLSSQSKSSAKKKVVRVGVVGCGYWGPNLIRNFQANPNCELICVCDKNVRQAQSHLRSYPQIRVVSDAANVLKDTSLDAIVIATPISQHYQIAKAAITSGKHVLIEKPLCSSSKEGQELIQLSTHHNVVLMVGHTFQFNPAVNKVKELLDNQELGKIFYIEGTRVNLGRYQSDGRNVLWDLAPHDISILLHWLKKTPLRVSAWGKGFLQHDIVDVVFLRLEFPDGTLAHLHMSWLAPSKIRRMSVVGDKKMAVYDDLESVEKVKVSDRGAQMNMEAVGRRIGYRLGDIISPRIDVTEPLHLECQHFLECILRKKEPLSAGKIGVEVVRVIEAAERSLFEHGEFVNV